VVEDFHTAPHAETGGPPAGLAIRY